MIDFLLNGIFSIFEAIVNFFTWLFIPREDFLLHWQQDISGRFNDRMGNVMSALSYIGSRMSNLQAYRNLGNIFEMEFPQGSILHGMSANLISPFLPFFSWLRLGITGVVVVITALAVYSKAQAMLQK